MNAQLYLSMIPEALVASMLSPEEFGTYMAVGSKKRSQGEAMFFALKPGFTSPRFNLARMERDCVPHADGQPKHSLYLGVYRVLEHVPLEALGSLYLVTRDGRVLELKRSDAVPPSPGRFHLYDEICPVHPLIASTLNPADFCRFVTDPNGAFNIPRICFVEEDLAGMADDADWGRNDPWMPARAEHIRDCLKQLQTSKKKHTKTVDRIHAIGGWGRKIKNGFYVGDQSGLLYYPFPSAEKLERDHHDWWRSAFL